LSGSGDTLYIDPYPDGLSSDGTVVIKGNLHVDGTTTSVNSTVLSINDPIIVIGDVTSTRTVMSPVASGVSTITIDSVVGINTGDIIQGSASLPNSGITTITAYNSTTKIITIEGTTTAGISTTTQLTITHAFDTNTDRGVAFDYNTGVGTANNKTGFFGYIDGTNTGSAAPARSWTYIPDSTITSPGNPSSPVITSKQILTAITKVTLSLPSSISVTAGDIIKQDTSGAYGIVETGGTLVSVSLIGVEGTFTNTYNIRKEGDNGAIQNLSITPSTVSTIYTNKPHWTSTLDGGTF